MNEEWRRGARSGLEPGIGLTSVGARRLAIATIPISIGFWAWMSLLAPAPLDSPVMERRAPAVATAPTATTAPTGRAGVVVGVVGRSTSTRRPCPVDGVKLPPGCQQHDVIGEPYSVQIPTADPTEP